jgi:hypothetical protein
MGQEVNEITTSNESYPSRNLEQLFSDDALPIHLARDATDDDPTNPTINENVDNDDMVL